ncbi:MAG TPA: DUF1330 domain-containing protein [Noviherbaspirillum sp.]|jgi:uncharacterized protein (DUF1330 family)|uniref:DUF1330 domain-containing protein n=1 Tax=Noviherbaspirillum sp. TaxID=1926288 RepID=UPI002DDCB9CA|nr:DUF1330 domain-containing protein [Noviherbaspirillum sp.]HEV2611834.1 DUF1330 domain-containing protein [Noviherbaspirillum sp.]
MSRSVDPTSDSVKQLVAKVPSDVPVVMLNLLRFRDQAVYPADKAEPARTGREAYAEYGRQIQPHLDRVGGKVIWQGEGKHAFIAPPDESWDEVLLVQYPSRDAFLSMLMSPDYQAITFHRTAALEDARLVVTVRG